MGWIEGLYGKTVGLDTSPLIFYIEEHPLYGIQLAPFFEAVDRGDIQLVTSAITLIEVLVHPLRNEDESLAQKYNDILLSSLNIATIPVSPATAQVAAEIRAKSNLKTPDSIILATAIRHGAEFFLTNDRDYGNVDELQVLRVSELPV